jgi:hypothetical protein
MKDPMEDINNPNWDLIKNMIEPKEEKKLICIKCNRIFYSPNYRGKKPYCPIHKFKEN